MEEKKNVHVQFVAARHPLSDIDTNVLQAQKSTLEFVWCGTLSDDAMKTPLKAKITFVAVLAYCVFACFTSVFCSLPTLNTF